MVNSILITGASAGIGHAVATRFLTEGWCVGLLARRQEPLMELAKLGQGIVIPCDVTDAPSVAKAVQAFQKKAGQIDVLFNNAGCLGPNVPIDEIDPADWYQVVDVNLHGMFHVAQNVFRVMRAQGGGRIINNGSVSAHVPRENSVGYSTTKHAITGLTKAMNLEGRDINIPVGQIDIGNAETQILSDLNATAKANAQPLNPVMDVDHVVDAVWYMAQLPHSTNVPFMTVMANQMPYMGRG